MSETKLAYIAFGNGLSKGETRFKGKISLCDVDAEAMVLKKWITFLIS